MSSSLTVGASTVTLDRVLLSGYGERGLRTHALRLTVQLATLAAFEAFRALESDIHVHEIPGGTSAYVDLLGGAGSGTLVIDGKGTYSGYLTEVEFDQTFPTKCRARAVFVATAKTA